MLSTVEAELKLIIAGNHDFSLDHTYDSDDSDEHEHAMELFKGPLAKEVCLSGKYQHWRKQSVHG